MNQHYQQALAAMSAEDVGFILSLLPTVEPTQGNAGIVPDSNDDNDESRRRRHIDREWPEVGAILTAEYFGEEYRAEVIPATKKLKSGRQIRLDSGPARGTVCDSFSEAMLTATEHQRNEQNLGRKGTSNGWVFWNWDGKPANTAGDGEDAPDA